MANVNANEENRDVVNNEQNVVENTDLLPPLSTENGKRDSLKLFDMCLNYVSLNFKFKSIATIFPAKVFNFVILNVNL